MSLQVEYVSLDSVFPYENNAKIHTDEQIDEIANSIKEFGMIDPIGIWKNNEIIEGHGRLLACKKLGIKEVPIIRLDELTDEQRKAYALAHNKLTMNTDFDFSILNEELASLEDIDMSLFGFEKMEIEEPKPIIEDNPPEEVEPRVKLGDLWQLGDHRLICGDSTDVAVIDRLMDGVKADMVFTDPPYGISVVGKSGEIGGSTNRNGKVISVQKYKPVENDDKEFDPSFITHLFGESKIFLWGANYFANKLNNSGKWLVWDKNRGEGTTFSDCELCWTNLDGVTVKKYKCTWDGMRREGEHEKRVHPTQKPIKLCSDIIKDFSQLNENVVDLFGGSGSTLIACEQLNRKCFMCELDPYYCDVIIERWENFTGKKAVLLNESE